MYIQSRDKNKVINLEKYDMLYLNDETNQIIAQKGSNAVILGWFDGIEDAKREFEDILETLMEESNIHEVE